MECLLRRAKTRRGMHLFSHFRSCLVVLVEKVCAIVLHSSRVGSSVPPHIEHLCRGFVGKSGPQILGGLRLIHG